LMHHINNRDKRRAGKINIKPSDIGKLIYQSVPNVPRSVKLAHLDAQQAEN